jgi:dienelactone hydrolase
MHFFLEHEKINNEISSFGPDSFDPTTKYNVTTQLSLSGQAKAFACQESLMLVLPSIDSDLVTVVLQPMDGLTIPFPKIRFYVYRGLLKSSFMTGNAIKPKTDPDSSDFIKRLWLGHERRQSCFLTITIPDPAPADLGFDESMANQGIEEIFNRAFTAVSPQLVREGEWIGDFGVNCCGFEIITDTDHLALDLNYAKNTEQIFDVSGFGTDIFKIRAEKEKVLNYLDSAAFWGMHYETGVDVYDATAADEHTTLKEGALYTAIIDKYVTQNRVYLDIRSEYGYSYNFYQNYTDGSQEENNLKFKTDHALLYTDHRYGKDWPIFFTDGTMGDPHDFGTYVIQLRVNDNIKPLIFIQNRKNTPSPALPPFVRDPDLLNGAATDWTKDIELRFPHFVEPLGSNVFVANYLRLQYFRQAVNPASPTTVHKNTLFINGVFGGISDGTTFAGTPFNMIRNNKKNLISGRDFSFVSETRIFYDTSKVVFMATLLFSDRASKRFFSVIPPTSKDKPLIASSNFPAEMMFNKFRVENAPGSQHADILQVAGYNEAKKAANKENIYMLGLTRAEFDTLRNLQGLSPDHNSYLEFEEIPPPFADKYGIPFRTHRLKIRGFKPDGTQIITVAPAVDIVVFSAGETIYCSKDFAGQQQHIPAELPDPGILSEWEYIGTDEYNDTTLRFIEDTNIFGTPPSTGLVNRNVHLKARVFFPAVGPGITSVGSDQANIVPGTFPLIIVVHGNGHFYTDYEDLCRFLAKNGFIVASIDSTFRLNMYIHRTTGNQRFFFMTTQTGIQEWYFDTSDSKVYDKFNNFQFIRGTIVTGTLLTLELAMRGMESLGRAKLLFEHLAHLETLLGASIDLQNIGLMGHSRGGEAVVAAARAGGGLAVINPDQTKFIIKSVISLAPSDQNDEEKLTGSVSYFVLYGSRDGDISGVGAPRYTGFSLWDRAFDVSQKSMAFVYHATHNGFITTNHDYPFLTEPHKPLPESIQKNIASSYMNAFFRMTLRQEVFWKPLFTGDVKPKSIVFPAKKGGIYLQYRESGQSRIVDDFQTYPAWDDSTIGGAGSHSVTFDSTPIPKEGALHTLVPSSPHNTLGLHVKWSPGAVLNFIIPTPKQDISSYSHLSFRISKVFGFSGLLKNLKVQLSHLSGTARHVTLSDDSLFKGFKIPDPDVRHDEKITRPGAAPWVDQKALTKSAMITVRIPLAKYQTQGVNLSNITNLSFLFPGTVGGTGGGEVIFDDIEFTT